MSRGRSAANDGPLTLVVGDDALAINTAAEICRLPEHRVTVVAALGEEFAKAAIAAGADFVSGRADTSEILDRAGVDGATTIIAVSRDDQLNLHAALLARDANPRIRIVLRQFNRTLAHKIEQNLPDTAVLSLAWHSAASYAATALDPSCFRGLQFPEPDGPLTGFVERIAAEEDFVGRSIAEVEAALGARVVAINGDTAVDHQLRIPWRARVCLYGTIEQLMKSALMPERGDAAPASAGSRKARSHPRWRIIRTNPYLWWIETDPIKLRKLRGRRDRYKTVACIVHSGMECIHKRSAEQDKRRWLWNSSWRRRRWRRIGIRRTC